MMGNRAMSVRDEELVPLFTVVVPVYNVEKYLEKCISSIIGQTYSNIEIILVDDGSTDNSSAMCDRYAEEDSRVTVIHQKNTGVSAARNTGIENANGEYIAFIDGDDYISNQMMECLYNRIVSDHSDVAICGYRCVDDMGHELNIATVEDAIVSGAEALRIHYERNTHGIMAITWNKLYRRRLFEFVRFPEGKRCEDEAVFYRILDLCGKVSILSEHYYYYVQHDDSFMGGTYKAARIDGIEVSYERFLFYYEHKDRYGDLLQPEGKVFSWLFYDMLQHFDPQTDEERRRVRDVCKIARKICFQREVKWTVKEKMKLLYPKFYVTAKKVKEKRI